MVTVKIDEGILVEILMDRVEFWTSNNVILELYKDYYEELINSGCFEGCELNAIEIVDNDYMYNLTTISKEVFEDYGIEDETDKRVVSFNKNEDLYLIKKW